MEIQNTQEIKRQQLTTAQLAIGVAAFVLLLASIFFGYRSGVARAHSLDTYHSVDVMDQALGYYFKDQSIYPTQEQFQNQQILTLNYLTKQPTPSDVAGVCAAQSDFDYARPTAQSFQLKFCLQQGVKGLSAGAHTLTQDGVQ